MNDTKKIAGINLLIMLVYNIVIHFANSGTEKGLGILILCAVLVGIQVITNLILCAIASGMKNSSRSKAYLISSGIVLLIGFSSCFANASIN